MTKNCWFFIQKFRVRCLAIHADTVETGWCSHNVITAQVKTEGIIQIDFEFEGTNFGGCIASELSFMGVSHTLINTVCESKYARSRIYLM